MSYTAEQSVIGCLLLDLSCMGEIYGQLKPEMFHSQLHGRMYLEFLRAYDNHQAMDAVLLLERLKDSGHADSDLQRQIADCIRQPSTSVMIRRYAKVVIDEYKAREVSRLLNQLKPSAGGIHAQIGELITSLEALRGGEKASGKKLSQIVAENKDRYFCRQDAGSLYTGFSRLDDALGSLEGGDMIVIGARPAVGKSALATQIALNLAEQGKRVGFFNLEMQEKQVYERFASRKSEIGLTRIRRARKFLGEEKAQFEQANASLCGLDIWISTGGKTVGQIRSESRHMDFDVILIDYLQLLRSDVRYQNRASEVGAVSKAIKSLAMELNIPIIALSQLNRVSEMKEDKEPTMAELREAGDIEQDASIILLLWNLSGDRKGLKVSKNRQGETGKIALRFNGDRMRFEETGETIKEASGWTGVEEETPFDREKG